MTDTGRGAAGRLGLPESADVKRPSSDMAEQAGAPGGATARNLRQTRSMNIEVTRILGDGSIRRARIEPEERPDAARWRELLSRANLDLPPPYRPDPGRPVYQVSDGEHSIQVAERGLVGPLRDLVAAVLAEGADGD